MRFNTVSDTDSTTSGKIAACQARAANTGAARLNSAGFHRPSDTLTRARPTSEVSSVIASAEEASIQVAPLNSATPSKQANRPSRTARSGARAETTPPNALTALERIQSSDQTGMSGRPTRMARSIAGSSAPART